MDQQALSLLAALKAREAKLGVIGLGYVGLPLSLTAAIAGFRVLGFDINEPRVVALNRGRVFSSTSQLKPYGRRSTRGASKRRRTLGA